MLGSLNSIRNVSHSSQRCQGHRGQCAREEGPQPAPRATKEKIWKATSRCSSTDQEDGKPQSFSFESSASTLKYLKDTMPWSPTWKIPSRPISYTEPLCL